MEWEFLRHPAFWVVVLILALAWKAGSIMERWHQENVRIPGGSNFGRRQQPLLQI